MTADPVPLSQVLLEELQATSPHQAPDAATIEAWRSAASAEIDSDAKTVDQKVIKHFYSWLHEQKIDRAALCFSGGGIRSATFGLGLIQGLARHQLLTRFDFLSTVSGGGYLGSWLSAWIRHTRFADPAAPPEAATAKVEEQLRAPGAAPLEPEPAPVRHLRSFSRYMSPSFGALSADTWTLVAIYLRNLILNWLVLVPLIAAVLMIPRISVLLVRLGSYPDLQAVKNLLILVLYSLAIVFGALSVAYFRLSLPSRKDISLLPERLRGQGPFLLLCQIPLILMAVAITVVWAWQTVEAAGAGRQSVPIVPMGPLVQPFLAMATFMILVLCAGWLVSLRWLKKDRSKVFVVAFFSFVPGAGLIWLVSRGVFTNPDDDLAVSIYAGFATSTLLLLFFLVSIIFVGFASAFTADEDREWIARAAGWFLISIGLRIGLSTIVIFGPILLLQSSFWFMSSIGGASGLATLLLGYWATSSTTDAGGGGSARVSQAEKVAQVALKLAAPIFVLSLLAGITLGTTHLLRWITLRFRDQAHVIGELKADGQDWRELLRLNVEIPGTSIFIVLGIFLLTSCLFGFLIDVNKFSLHGAYRNRLIRAYLGASRLEGEGPSRRRPNSFTGFDPDDNFEVAELRGNRPLPVINIALNLVKGADLAWQDRKAESFTISPWHAGSLHLGYRSTLVFGRNAHNGRAISLGTALAISGAAASPNMGYHSSPVVTFLMALFNVRLGWWLGNPGKAGTTTYNRPGPRFAPMPLILEALGMTSDQRGHVYLSDGGHFENLALYEMVLRRCRFIVLSDGGCDPQFTFEDLGNAVAKIRVDLGVPIVFGKIEIRGFRGPDGKVDLGASNEPRAYHAWGRICYSAIDGCSPESDGWLLYIKPTLAGNEPIDVLNYARASKEFPHESTSDQLYSERQFESYRALGAHVMTTLLADIAPGTELAAVFEKIPGDWPHTAKSLEG